MSSILDSEYYPTPHDVVIKMVEGINYLDSLKILEPSAGSGNILDSISKMIIDKICLSKYSHSRDWYNSNSTFKKKWKCIEILPDLQAILKDKGYSVIDSDFLKHIPETTYELIIMNPPFSQGVKHLLHAIKVCEGAEIRCLLNAETINNPYSKERQLLLHLIKQLDGEIVSLGNCFSTAERTTDVEVVLVKIPFKERKTKFEFKAGSTQGEKNFNFEHVQSNQVAKADMIESVIDSYTMAKKVFADFLTKKAELEFYLNGLMTKNTTVDNIVQHSFDQDYDIYYDNFVNNLRQQCWQNILNDTKIDNVITESVRKDFNKFIEQQSSMAFTADNIEQLFYTITNNRVPIMEQCIVNAFDHMTKFYVDNRNYIEGWKTDSSWKVNRKVILPSIVEVSYKGLPSLRHSSQHTINDIEKSLCFIAGMTYKSIKYNTITYIINDNAVKEFGVWYYSQFFKFKLFKKGTLHLEFIDKFIHEQFNIMACKGKMWIGDGI